MTKSHYHHHSIQGKRHLRSYMHKIEKDDEVYSFIAVDACLDPGPRRPFNFIGLVTPEEFQTLQGFERESRTTNGTVWFGHYPTSTVISPVSMKYYFRFCSYFSSILCFCSAGARIKETHEKWQCLHVWSSPHSCWVRSEYVYTSSHWAART